MIKITHRFGIGSTFGLALAATLVAAALVAPAAIAGVAQIQERGTLLGPNERETLTSWTGRWLEGPVQYIATGPHAVGAAGGGPSGHHLDAVNVLDLA